MIDAAVYSQDRVYRDGDLWEKVMKCLTFISNTTKDPSQAPEDLVGPVVSFVTVSKNNLGDVREPSFVARSGRLGSKRYVIVRYRNS
jgi:hypothetical protein